MYKTLRTFAAIALCAALPSLSFAASSPVTKISLIQVVKSSNSAIIVLADPITEESCATIKTRMIISLSTVAGRAQLATALTAVNADKKVKLVGANSCVGVMEEVNLLMLID